MKGANAELAAPRDRVDGHDAQLDALFDLMRDVVRQAGLDPNAPPMRRTRRERRLHLVKGEQQQ